MCTLGKKYIYFKCRITEVRKYGRYASVVINAICRSMRFENVNRKLVCPHFSFRSSFPFQHDSILWIILKFSTLDDILSILLFSYSSLWNLHFLESVNYVIFLTIDNLLYLSHWPPKRKWRQFTDNIVECIFVIENCCILITNFSWTNIGSDIGLAPNVRQAITLRWRHNGNDSVSNHQPDDCLLNHLFRRRSKKASKLRVTGLCAGNSPGTGEFPAQMASNAENVSIWWRHHDLGQTWSSLLTHTYMRHPASI